MMRQRLAALFGLLTVMSTAVPAASAGTQPPLPVIFGNGNSSGQGEADTVSGSTSFISPDGRGGASVALAGSEGCGGCTFEFVVACMFNTPTNPQDALCGNAVATCPSGSVRYWVYFVPRPGAAREPRGSICRGGATGAVALDDVLDQVRTISSDFLTVPQPSLVVQPASGAITGLLAIVSSENPGAWEKDFFGIPGFTVRVTATPSSWDWGFSNGDRLSTTDPGRAFDGTPTGTSGPYSSGYYIGTTFTRPGSGSVSLTMSWSATAVIQGLPPVTLAGLPAVGPATADFPIRSAGSQLVNG